LILKHAIVCTAWRAYRRNTLYGFADIKIAALRLTIRDITVHQQSGSRWAQLPAKPQLRNGQLHRDEAGKLVYATLLEFDSREVRDAFSRAVVEALLDLAPEAFADVAA
jgi:hypothetical protein